LDHHRPSNDMIIHSVCLELHGLSTLGMRSESEQPWTIVMIYNARVRTRTFDTLGRRSRGMCSVKQPLCMLGCPYLVAYEVGGFVLSVYGYNHSEPCRVGASVSCN
jgi:hypothetical protein